MATWVSGILSAGITPISLGVSVLDVLWKGVFDRGWGEQSSGCISRQKPDEPRIRGPCQEDRAGWLRLRSLGRFGLVPEQKLSPPAHLRAVAGEQGTPDNPAEAIERERLRFQQKYRQSQERTKAKASHTAPVDSSTYPATTAPVEEPVSVGFCLVSFSRRLRCLWSLYKSCLVNGLRLIWSGGAELGRGESRGHQAHFVIEIACPISYICQVYRLARIVVRSARHGCPSRRKATTERKRPGYETPRRTESALRGDESV